jgi:hypothetical protein
METPDSRNRLDLCLGALVVALAILSSVAVIVGVENVAEFCIGFYGGGRLPTLTTASIEVARSGVFRCVVLAAAFGCFVLCVRKKELSYSKDLKGMVIIASDYTLMLVAGAALPLLAFAVPVLRIMWNYPQNSKAFGFVGCVTLAVGIGCLLTGLAARQINPFSSGGTVAIGLLLVSVSLAALSMI